MISILTINIGAASRARAEAILEWLADRPEDVFILTETSAGEGTAFLLERFAAAGYFVIADSRMERERGVAIVSRVKVVAEPQFALGETSIPCRVAVALLETTPQVTVVGIYVPSRDQSAEKVEKKQLFVESLLRQVERLDDGVRRATVVGGDYNVISKTHVPKYSTFLDFEYAMLERLEAAGLSDAQVHLSGATQVHSWVGRTGDGYKYDYFHVGADLASGLHSCDYLSESRDLALTDHSAVALVIDGVSAQRVDAGRLSTTDQIALF